MKGHEDYKDDYPREKAQEDLTKMSNSSSKSSDLILTDRKLSNKLENACYSISGLWAKNGIFLSLYNYLKTIHYVNKSHWLG